MSSLLGIRRSQQPPLEVAGGLSKTGDGASRPGSAGAVLTVTRGPVCPALTCLGTHVVN